MGHHLRKDMTCLNCGHVVEKRFCPNCGQENKETKESFHYLFFHTVEDLVHYDSAFWKTIKYLLFYPAKLTLEYLSGKRNSYVPPVKLYIFISFIAFFILSILPSTSKIEGKDFVSLNNNETNKIITLPTGNPTENFNGYKSLKEYDSIQNVLPLAKKSKGFERWIERRLVKIGSENTTAEFIEKLIHTVFKNIPKALFAIMPLFAFVLWLFHNKRKWYYFDNGIFTIHYFSMILLSFTIFSLLDWLMRQIKNIDISSISGFIATVMIFWWIFYFFRSHSRIYKESKLVSRIKAAFIFLINLSIIFIVSLFLLLYSALNVN